ncbi:MAG: hypothetical protein L0387_25590, partial [Acidobacteria bacterium]|nr:hypothetical protein [Acidobacteriota bacterium]
MQRHGNGVNTFYRICDEIWFIPAIALDIVILIGLMVWRYGKPAPLMPNRTPVIIVFAAYQLLSILGAYLIWGS